MKVNLPDGRTIVGVKGSRLAHAEESTESAMPLSNLHPFEIRYALSSPPPQLPHQGPNEADLDLIHRNR